MEVDIIPLELETLQSGSLSISNSKGTIQSLSLTKMWWITGRYTAL